MLNCNSSEPNREEVYPPSRSVYKTEDTVDLRSEHIEITQFYNFKFHLLFSNCLFLSIFLSELNRPTESQQRIVPVQTEYLLLSYFLDGFRHLM